MTDHLFKKGLSLIAVKRMKLLYAVIIRYKRDHKGASPTLRSLSELIEEQTKILIVPSLIKYYIEELEKLGLVDSTTMSVRNSAYIYYGTLLDDFRVINHAYKGRVKARNLAAEIMGVLDEEPDAARPISYAHEDIDNI